MTDSSIQGQAAVEARAAVVHFGFGAPKTALATTPDAKIFSEKMC